jgi:hypothetical protein
MACDSGISVCVQTVLTQLEHSKKEFAFETHERIVRLRVTDDVNYFEINLSGRDLEHRSAAGEATIKITAIAGSAIQIARFVEDQAGDWMGPVR